MVSEHKSKEDKIRILRDYWTPTMQDVIIYAYDSRIKWLLPEGVPPFKATRGADTQGMFYKEARRLYLFVEGGNSNLKPRRREELFIELLETIDGDDAEVVLKMKEKKLPYGITKKLVQEAFPHLELQ